MLRGALSGGAVLGAAACSARAAAATRAAAGAVGAAAARPRAPRRTRSCAPAAHPRGATAAGAKDTIDAHLPTADTDIMRVWNMYESLAVRTPDFSELEMLLAESIEPEEDGDLDDPPQGRPRRSTTASRSPPTTSSSRSSGSSIPKRPEVAPPSSPTSTQAASRRSTTARSVRLKRSANSRLLRRSASTSTAIVPTDYDPKKPVGTGPFKYESFTPGQQSTFVRFDDYWGDGRRTSTASRSSTSPTTPARVNALLGGQVDVDRQRPGRRRSPSSRATATCGARSPRLAAGNPFAMRVDTAPFDDVRVRQAFRLIVDRQQMVDQVLGGNGRIGNDLYGRFDPATTARPAAARAGHRAGQVAAQAGRPARASRSSSSPRRRRRAWSRRRRCSPSRPRAPGVTVKRPQGRHRRRSTATTT